MHRGVEHAREVAFHLIAGEERQALVVELHVLGVGRHDHLHEVLGHAIATLALDQHLVDLLGIKIADRALDQVAFLVDRRGGHGLERHLADLFPQPQQVFVVALDLGPGALAARRADDQARALRHVKFAGNILQLLAIGRVGDLAADAAAAGGVGHQDAIAARQRQIGGQRRALVAAFFLDHLDQHDLADLDHLLDLVAARTRLLGDADFLADILIGHRFNAVILVDRIRCAGLFTVGPGILRDDLVTIFGLLGLCGFAAFSAPRSLFGLLRLGMGAFLGQQCIAVGGGDLVIIGMDLCEGQEAVAIAAVIDKRRLQRGFDPRDLCQIDVSRNLPSVYGLEIKFLDLGSVDNDHPSLFGMGCVDQHFLCHCHVFRAALRRAAPVAPRKSGCVVMGTRARRVPRPVGRPGPWPAPRLFVRPLRASSRLFLDDGPVGQGPPNRCLVSPRSRGLRCQGRVFPRGTCRPPKVGARGAALRNCLRHATCD